MGKRFLTTERFVDKATAIHGTTYDYGGVIYVRAPEKVAVGCKTHGDFL